MERALEAGVSTTEGIRAHVGHVEGKSPDSLIIGGKRGATAQVSPGVKVDVSQEAVICSFLHLF